MTIPLIPRIGALVLATTGFYAYVGSMVPQNEVQPPPTSIVIPADLTTDQMVTVGREVMDTKGLCFTCHTIGRTGALRFPDLAGVGERATDPRPGPERCRVLRPIAVRARGLHRAGIQSGDARHQQASDRPYRSGDPLRDRVPPVPWRHADGHAPDELTATTHRRPHRARRRPQGRRAPAAPPRQGRAGRASGRAGRSGASRRSSRSGGQAGCASGSAERRPGPRRPREGAVQHEHPGRPRRCCRVRASPLPSRQSAVVGRRLVGGDLRPAPIRIHHPDSRLRHLDLHGNRLARDPGVPVLQPAAP